MDNIELLGINDFYLFGKGICFVWRCIVLIRMLILFIIIYFLIFCIKNDEKLLVICFFFVFS